MAGRGALGYNGGVVVDEVDLLARRVPSFCLFLGGVWDNSIEPGILARLASYRGTRGEA